MLKLAENGRMKMWRKSENGYVQMNWERSDERFERWGDLY